jgi:hypothetical protein
LRAWNCCDATATVQPSHASKMAAPSTGPTKSWQFLQFDASTSEEWSRT